MSAVPTQACRILVYRHLLPFWGIYLWGDNLPAIQRGQMLNKGWDMQKSSPGATQPPALPFPSSFGFSWQKKSCASLLWGYWFCISLRGIQFSFFSFKLCNPEQGSFLSVFTSVGDRSLKKAIPAKVLFRLLLRDKYCPGFPVLFFRGSTLS